MLLFLLGLYPLLGGGDFWQCRGFAGKMLQCQACETTWMLPSSTDQALRTRVAQWTLEKTGLFVDLYVSISVLLQKGDKNTAGCTHSLWGGKGSMLLNSHSAHFGIPALQELAALCPCPTMQPSSRATASVSQLFSTLPAVWPFHLLPSKLTGWVEIICLTHRLVSSLRTLLNHSWQGWLLWEGQSLALKSVWVLLWARLEMQVILHCFW